MLELYLVIKPFADKTIDRTQAHEATLRGGRVKLLIYDHPERCETTELAKLVVNLTTQMNESVKRIDNPSARSINNLPKGK